MADEVFNSFDASADQEFKEKHVGGGGGEGGNTVSDVLLTVVADNFLNTKQVSCRLQAQSLFVWVVNLHLPL